MKRILCALLITVQVGASPLALASDDAKLERVEQQGSTTSDTSGSSHHHHHYGYDSSGSLILDLLFFLFVGLFNTYNDGSLTTKEFHALLKSEYHPALPTVRLEGDYHTIVDDDVQAYRLNALAGYLALAAEFDWVHYFEQTPTDQLRIMSPRLLLRGSPNRVFEINLTLGAKILSGRRSQAGFEIGLPVYFYLGKHAIIDLKNYYSVIKGADVYDGSFGVSGKWKLGGVRAAYRLIRVGSENLHGPEVGMFVQW